MALERVANTNTTLDTQNAAAARRQQQLRKSENMEAIIKFSFKKKTLAKDAYGNDKCGNKKIRNKLFVGLLMMAISRRCRGVKYIYYATPWGAREGLQ